MDQQLSRLLTASALAVSLGVLAVAACTRTTDRVVEPVGGNDASTTSPDLTDAGANPIGPIAHPSEPQEDYRLVRAPELGLARATQLVNLQLATPQPSGVGGRGAGGSAGYAGTDMRPVACGGYY